MNTMDTCTLDTPVGPFTMVTGPDGTVRAAGFTADPAPLLTLVHPSLVAPVRTRSDLGTASRAVLSYLDGELDAIDTVPVEQRSDGTFLGPAWQTLRAVKPGAAITYTAFAELTGRPRAVRAAATACARNAVALFVPCHRVLRTDGSLGGYRWGLDVKKWLLGHERQLTSS